jgi:hypothetical protein
VVTRGDAPANGAFEVAKRIVANAGLFVRRDVARIDRADRGRQRQATSKRLPSWRGVAGGAVTLESDIGAALDELLIEGLRESRGAVAAPPNKTVAR